MTGIKSHRKEVLLPLALPGSPETYFTMNEKSQKISLNLSAQTCISVSNKTYTLHYALGKKNQSPWVFAVLSKKEKTNKRTEKSGLQMHCQDTQEATETQLTNQGSMKILGETEFKTV